MCYYLLHSFTPQNINCSRKLSFFSFLYIQLDDGYLASQNMQLFLTFKNKVASRWNTIIPLNILRIKHLKMTYAITELVCKP